MNKNLKKIVLCMALSTSVLVSGNTVKYFNVIDTVKADENVTTKPVITDPNGASIEDVPFNKAGYALDPNGDRLTFGVWQFLRTDHNTGNKTNFDYYATLSVDRSAITGAPGANPKVYLRIVKKSTGAEVYTRELNAGDSDIQLPSFITNNAADVTNTITYSASNGTVPGVVTFSLVHANLEYETLQIRDLNFPGNEGEDKPNVQTSVPSSKADQTTYYKLIDETKYTEGQPYKPTGNETVLAKYTQEGLAGQQFTASENREIKGYEKVLATTDTTQLTKGILGKGVIGQKLVELQGGANHYYVKRISEIVDTEGSTVTKIYALDPSEVDNFTTGDIGSTDVSKYTLLYTTKVNAPGEIWKAENININVDSKNGDYYINITATKGNDRGIDITGWFSKTEKVTENGKQYDKPFTKAPDESLTPAGKGNNGFNTIAGKTPEFQKDKDGSDLGFVSFANNYSIPSALKPTTDVNYYFRKINEGEVIITYVDDKGNEIKDPKQDTPKSPIDTPYDTTEKGETPDKDEKPKTIEKDGKTYKIVPKGDYPVGKVDENGHLENSDPIKGKVEKSKTTVTYVYKQVGNVYVHYKDTEGNVLKASVTDMDKEIIDSDYDTVVDNRPNEIEKDGKTYVLVPAGSYTVGEVDDQGHLKSSDDTIGKVAEQDKNVTYIYKLKEDPKKGEVVITYVDENGNELKDPKQDTPKSPYDTPYDTTEEGEKPNTIEKDGKTYKLVPKGDYPVGKVDENGHLVSSDPITGKVDKPKSVITYVYKEVKEDPVQPKGNVYVHYKDTEGNELKTSVKDMDQQPVDSDYDTVVDNRPNEIEKDGKTYVLVPAGNYTVGEVDNQGHLKSSDPTTGKVAEQDKNVTYIYKLKEDPTPQPQPDPAQPKGNVYVYYKDTEGNVIKSRVTDEDAQPVDKDYDTVVDNRPQEIVKDGKTYVLVPAGNYTVGSVDSEGHLESSDSTTGKVVEGDKHVTYIYKLKEEPVVPGKPGKPGEPGKPGDPGKGNRLPKTGVASSSALLSLVTVLTGAMGIVINSKKRK